MYKCIWMCVFLHAWAGTWKECVSSQLMGCLEWARPLGQQWDEVRLLFKVYRVVLGMYSSAAAGQGYKKKGVKRWVRKMVKSEQSEGLERQRDREVLTVNSKTSGLIFVSRQIPLRLSWYWRLYMIVLEIRQKISYRLIQKLLLIIRFEGFFNDELGHELHRCLLTENNCRCYSGLMILKCSLKPNSEAEWSSSSHLFFPLIEISKVY